MFRLQPKHIPSGKLKIDPSHPLAMGLIACWVPGVGLQDLCGTGLDLNMNTTVAAFGNSFEGIDATTTAAGATPGGGLFTGSLSTGHPLRNWSELTLYWRGVNTVLNSLDESRNSRIAIDWDNAISNPYLVAGFYHSGGSLQLAWNTNGNFTAGATVNVAFAANRLFSVAATFKIGGNAIAYCDGVQSGSPTSFGAIGPTYSATSYINIAGLGSASSMNAKTYVTYFWNRQLSADEISALDADPYGFLIPEYSSEEVPPLVPAAPATTTSAGLGWLPARYRPHPKQKPLGPVKVDWSNPVAYGLIDCLIFNEGAGPPINLAAPSIITTLASNPTWTLGQDGPGGSVSAGSSFDIPRHAPLAWYQSSFTARIRFKPISWPGAYTTIIDCVNASNQRQFSIFINTSGNINYFSIDTGSGVGLSIATGFTVGIDYDFVITYDRAGPTAYFYVNGLLVGSPFTNTPEGLVDDAGSVRAIGRNASGGGQNANAVYYAFQQWNRILTTEEIRYLAADPYGFLIPDESFWSGPALTEKQQAIMQHALILTDSWD